MTKPIFHLAIPCKELAETKEFYCDQLGFEHGRIYDDRISLNIFEAQVVCHLCPEKVDTELNMYPRHFGATFTDESEFDDFYHKAKAANVRFYKECFMRFEGMKEQHKTFFFN